MSLRDQLQAIYDSHGNLTPAIVVDEARDEAHPLHDRFEWDNIVAGEAWRKRQAHELIRSVKVVYRPATDSEGERSVRAFHAVPSDDGDDRYWYEPADKVALDSATRELLVREMQRDWQELKRRWAYFQEFVGMVLADLKNEEAA